MAIRRCPYCKAIIDEEDKYCNNCGTQLLFPEDETIEEDIPGDKLIDDDRVEEAGEEEFVEEELEETEFIEKGDTEEDKLGQGKEELLPDEEGEGLLEGREGEELSLEVETEEADKEEGQEEEIEEERLEEYLADTGEDEEKVHEEEDLIEEREDEGDLRTAGGETSVEETEDEEAEISDVEREAVGWPFEEESTGEREEDLDKELEEAEAPTEEKEGQEEEVEEEAEEEIEQPPSDRFAKGDQEKKYEVSIEADELVFKTRDQDQLPGSAELGKKEIDDLLSTYARSKPADKGTPPAEEESHPRSHVGEPTPGTKEDLPPWASGIKEISSSSLQEEMTKSDETATPREWTADSGVGFPERLTQNTLPFSDTSAQRVEEEPVEEEAEKPEAKQRPHALSSRLRAKLVDVLFITALWLISLWFTAQVIGVSFFRLIFGSLLPVLAFYLILLFLYFFLFIYFLGETLGDHYFSEED